MEVAELKHVQNEKVCVNRKSLEALLQQCQLALQQLASGCENAENGLVVEHDTPQGFTDTSAVTGCDSDTTKLYSLLKSRFQCDDFLENFKNVGALLPQDMAEEASSWEVLNKNDLWGARDVEAEMEDYVLVQQEDIAEGIASFMAAYLLSLERTKDMSPDQLQQALNKTFSLKKKKSKLRKAWDGSMVIYNVASWGATAVGVYQNPALLSAASTVLTTSLRTISNLL
ncbi:uncharacterized protein LOC127248488 isoform X2 [Andrographis paniculata]|nr:uncharacterized protein LOC127248488 isoform X2 [Andrographis paniculata]